MLKVFRSKWKLSRTIASSITPRGQSNTKATADRMKIDCLSSKFTSVPLSSRPTRSSLSIGLSDSSRWRHSVNFFDAIHLINNTVRFEPQILSLSVTAAFAVKNQWNPPNMFEGCAFITPMLNFLSPKAHGQPNQHSYCKGFYLSNTQWNSQIPAPEHKVI